jgi:sucrose synthase
LLIICFFNYDDFNSCSVILIHDSNKDFVLELDFEPFNASFPRPSLSKSIGNGVQFLNRHLSSKLFHDKESMYPLLNFLRAHNYKGMVS